MTITEDVEEIEILKARFDTLDQEMRSNSDKVDTVSELASQLLQNEHPNSDEVLSREKDLTDKWSELRELADQKKDSLTLAHSVNTWHIECRETMVSYSVNTWHIECRETMVSYSVNTWHIECRETMVSYSVNTWHIECRETMVSYSVNTWHIECRETMVSYSTRSAPSKVTSR